MTYSYEKLQAFEVRMSTLIPEAHQGQRYGDRYYTYHLRMVRNKIMELFEESKGLTPTYKDLQLSTVALGHDLFEDTYVTRELLLAEGYHEDIIHAIDLVTKREGVSYKEYLRTLSKDEIAWKVKVADTYANLTESIKDLDIKRSRKYATQIELLMKYKGWEE